MIVWVIYDIVSDAVRRRIIKATENAGLYRVQKSVFLGTVEKNRLDELVMKVEDLINPDIDSVYIFPMCKEDFGKTNLLGQAFDEELVGGTLESLVL